MLANNSIVAWTDIGEGNASLMCLTNKSDCCRDVSESGKWVFPNQTDVHSMNATLVHQLYGNSAIFLQRQSETQLASGIFHCHIMDENGTEQHLYIGIYQETPTRKH